MPKRLADNSEKSGGDVVGTREPGLSVQAKTKALYAVALAFAVILAFVWLSTIKNSFTGRSDALGLSMLAKDFSAHLGKFDAASTQNRTSTQPVINITAISASIQSEISAQTTTESWPQRQLPAIQATLRSPERWQVKARGQKYYIQPSASSSSYLVIESLSNSKRLPLGEWQSANSKELTDKILSKAASSTIASTTIYRYSLGSSTLSAYYIAKTGSDRVIKAMVAGNPAPAELGAIIERIIASINVSK